MQCGAHGIAVKANSHPQLRWLLYLVAPALFMVADPVISLVRDAALSGLDLLPPLKRNFVDHAAGVAALGER